MNPYLMSPTIVQVNNVSACASLEEMKKLFRFLGEIEDIKLYPSDDELMTSQFRVCYIKYVNPKSVNVAQHLTNTVFLDRALIVKPISDIYIPSEDKILLNFNNPEPALPGLGSLNGNNNLINNVEAVDGKLVISTIDPNLSVLNLPEYPSLPASLDPKTIEETRRTIYIGNLNSMVTADQLLRFVNQIIGEVKYVRMTGENSHSSKFAYVEFTERVSVIKALQSDGVLFNGRQLKINHSSTAIVKPNAKTNMIVLKEVEVAMKRVREAESLITATVEPEIAGARKKHKRRSRSRSRSEYSRRHHSVSRSTRRSSSRARSKHRSRSTSPSSRHKTSPRNSCHRSKSQQRSTRGPSIHRKSKSPSRRESKLHSSRESRNSYKSTSEKSRRRSRSRSDRHRRSGSRGSRTTKIRSPSKKISERRTPKSEGLQETETKSTLTKNSSPGVIEDRKSNESFNVDHANGSESSVSVSEKRSEKDVQTNVENDNNRKETHMSAGVSSKNEDICCDVKSKDILTIGKKESTLSTESENLTIENEKVKLSASELKNEDLKIALEKRSASHHRARSYRHRTKSKSRSPSCSVKHRRLGSSKNDEDRSRTRSESSSQKYRGHSTHEKKRSNSRHSKSKSKTRPSSHTHHRSPSTSSSSSGD